MSTVKVPIPKTTPEIPPGWIYDPIRNQSRKRYPWDRDFEYEQEEEEYTPFPISPKVFHFHPIAFVEQMRRMEDDLSLIWGSKVSLEFRKKVVEVSKRLKCDPNHLMACMALETGGSFDPAITNSLGYTGLIQIGKDAAKDISRRKKITITTDDLRKMTAVEQLTYVEYYLDHYAEKNKLNTLADFYLSIIFPVDVGKGNTGNHIVFDNSLTITTDSKGKIIKNLNYYRNKGYDANPAFHKEQKENGKTYVWEIEKVILSWFEKGEKYRN